MYQMMVQKNYLSGFTTVNDLALLTTGQLLANATTENKVIKIWNKDQAKEVPTEVPCITALHGKPIKLGILEEITFKQTKDANGNYVDTAETRTSNVINKVFMPQQARLLMNTKPKLKLLNLLKMEKNGMVSQTIKQQVKHLKVVPLPHVQQMLLP